MIEVGQYNTMKVIKEKPMGFFLDDGDNGILLPKRFIPEGLKIGDTIKVFLYHDGEDRLIATTQQPLGVLGDIVMLRVLSTNNHGAFLDWGLMKDLFVPRSKQRSFMRTGGEYIVKIMKDEQTGRLYATEKIEPFLSNESLTVKEMETADMLVYRKTNIGYVVIINNQHTGLLHFNEVYRDIFIGNRFKGYIKKITKPANKDGVSAEYLIDVAAGMPGYNRVDDESMKVLQLLKENDGYLPYNDASAPEDIYSFFAMSKKTFKMTTGKLYKEKKIEFTQTGIKML